MKNHLIRYYGRRELHFITFSCYERRPLLGSAQARNLFLKILAEVREEYRFVLIGYVLMPNHVHLLIGEPAQVTPSTALQVLKQRMSRAMLPQRPVVQIALADRSGGSKPMPFWQRRFYDFNVYTRGKIKKKLNYMHANPVTRKLVSHPKDWPWSSWSFMNVEKMG